jgi:hypothetical protein
VEWHAQRGTEGEGRPYFGDTGGVQTPELTAGRPDREKAMLACICLTAVRSPCSLPAQQGGERGGRRYTGYDYLLEEYPVMNRDGRAIARNNEVRILRALNRFGWLRTRDLAVLVWQLWAAQGLTAEPALQARQPTPAALRMAQRTLARLRDGRQVLSSRAPDGSTLYTLAEAGARSLQALGIEASSGKDLLRDFSSSHYRHRCVANDIAIGSIVDGFRVTTERETAQGLWFGGTAGIAGKRPDVVLRNGQRLWWVEVERSRKNAKDYSALLDWLEIVRQDAGRGAGAILLGANLAWARVIFVCVPAFRTKLIRDLLERGWQKNQVNAFISFETSLYQFGDINFS